MKPLKYIALIAALASGLALTAKADLILSPFGDIPKNGTGINGGNSDNQANNFFRLVNYIAANPTFGSLGTPTLAGAEQVTGDLSQPVDLTGFCYAVVHYGVGEGGNAGSGSSTMASVRVEFRARVEESLSSKSRTIQTPSRRVAPARMVSAGFPRSICSNAFPLFRIVAQARCYWEPHSPALPWAAVT